MDSPKAPLCTGLHPKAGPRLESHTLELFQMLASSRIQSRCFLEPACLPACWAPTPHPRPAHSCLQTLTYLYTLGQPWGPEQMFSLCLSAPSPRTHMCLHAHTHPHPHPSCLGGPKLLLDFLPLERLSPPPPSVFLLHSPDLPHLNTAWVSRFPHPLSLTLHQIFCCSLWESDVRG